jgi:hypothetical protein
MDGTGEAFGNYQANEALSQSLKLYGKAIFCPSLPLILFDILL